MKLWSYAFCALLLVTPFAAQAEFFGNECPQPAVSGTGASFETAFAPDDKLSDLIVKSIKSAQKSVKVAAHRFVSKEVSIALLAALRNGRSVEMVLDRADQDDGKSSAGFFVNMSHPPHYQPGFDQYEDYIIIDDKDLVIGNISSIAAADDEKKNSAGVLVIHNAGEGLIKRYSQNWQKLYAGSDTVKNMNLIHVKDGKQVHGE